MNYYNPNFYQNYPYMQNNINSRIVDSIEMVKAADVPIGGYGIFQKADLSEVYIKSWNQNGTTSIITYKPDINQMQDPILERLVKLEEKIDSIIDKNIDNKQKKEGSVKNEF